MVVGLTGYYGFGNVGDDLCLRNLIRYYGNENVHVYCSRPYAAETVKRQFHVAASTVNQLGKHQLDMLVFGGGDLIHDLSFEALWPRKYLERVTCRVILLGVGVPHGNGFTLLSKRLKWLGKRVAYAGLRDMNSLSIYRRLIGENACFTADPAFLTENLHAERGDVGWFEYRNLGRDYQLLTPEDYPSGSYAAQLKMDDLFFGYDTRIWSYGAEKISLNEALRRVSTAKHLICGSLHLGLLALSQETPFKIVPYQGKVCSVMDAAGCLRHTEHKLYPVSKKETERFLMLQKHLKDVLERFGKGVYSPVPAPFQSEGAELYVSKPIKPNLLRRAKYFYNNNFVGLKS